MQMTKLDLLNAKALHIKQTESCICNNIISAGWMKGLNLWKSVVFVNLSILFTAFFLSAISVPRSNNQISFLISLLLHFVLAWILRITKNYMYQGNAHCSMLLLYSLNSRHLFLDKILSMLGKMECYHTWEWKV